MTTDPGVIPANADFICALKALPEVVYGPIGSTRGLDIYILNFVTWNLASKSKFSKEAETTDCPLSCTAEIRPPSLPPTFAVGLGMRFTRNFVAPKFCTLPSMVALTLRVTSPGLDTLAIYLPPPLEDKVTPAPESFNDSAGMPGAEIDNGLSTPIYITFIASGDTTADGLAT